MARHGMAWILQAQDGTVSGLDAANTKCMVTGVKRIAGRFREIEYCWIVKHIVLAGKLYQVPHERPFLVSTIESADIYSKLMIRLEPL